MLHDHSIRQLRSAVVNLLHCLWRETVVTINTLWLVVFLPGSVSFWFPGWVKKTRHRNPADIVSQPLFLIASYYFVRNSTGADECSIKQAGLAAGIAEVGS